MLIPPPVNKLGAPPLTPDTMLRVSVHFINQHCEGGAGGALKFVDRLFDWKHGTNTALSEKEIAINCIVRSAYSIN